MYRDRYLHPDDYCEDTGYDEGAIEVESDILQYGSADEESPQKTSREPETPAAAAKSPAETPMNAPTERAEAPAVVEEEPVRRRPGKHAAPKPTERKKTATRNRPATTRKSTVKKKTPPADKSTSARATGRAGASGRRTMKQRSR